MTIRLVNWLPAAKQVSVAAGRESKMVLIQSSDPHAFGIAAQRLTYQSGTA